MNLAFAYLNDVADKWYQGLSKRRIELNWYEFVDDFCARFEVRTMTVVVDELNKLKQEESVEHYQTRFKELRSIVPNNWPRCEENWFTT